MNRMLALLMLASAVLLGGCRARQNLETRPFDSALWKSGTDRVRGEMAYDLISRRLLEGKTRQGVLELLGPPYKQPLERDDWWYGADLGIRGYPQSMVGDSYFWVRFDRSGIVSGYGADTED